MPGKTCTILTIVGISILWISLLALLLGTPIVTVLGLAAKNNCANCPIDGAFSYVKSDTLKLAPEQAQSRRAELIETLRMLYSSSTASRISREQTRMQIRLFYAAILAALLSTAFFSKSPSNYAHLFLAGAAVVTTILMYSLDVHFLDVNNRTVPIDSGINRAFEQLHAEPPSSRATYALAFQDIARAINQVGADEERRSRKICYFFAPNLEQAIFYMAPLFASSVMLLFAFWGWLEERFPHLSQIVQRRTPPRSKRNSAASRTSTTA